MSFISSLGEWLRKVSKSFMNATISGKTITLTRHNGDTITLTTQDTTYEEASQSTSGLMSTDDKKKLDGISAGAEVNQNAFASVLVDSTNVAADTKSDTLTLVAGNNITLTADATNDKITIAAKDTVTTVNTTGNGNAVTSITASNGALTVKKDSTFSLSNHTHSSVSWPRVPANDYVDVVSLYDADAASNRTGTIRISNGNGYHEMLLGVHNEADGWPTGLIITNRNGTVTSNLIGSLTADDFIKKTPTTSYVKKFYDGTMIYAQFWWPLNQSYSSDGSFEIVYPEAFKQVQSVVGVATEGFFRPVYIANNKINFWVIKPDGTFQTSNPIVSLIVIGYYR